MQTLWFILVALMLTAYVVLDGFDLGAGALHLFAARTDRGAAHAAACHRTGVGRQRGLAAGRRWNAVLRLSAALRIQLQRLLSAAQHRSVAAGFPRRSASNFACTWTVAFGATSSTPSFRSPACCSSCCSARPLATSCAACRSAPITTSSFRSGPTSGPVPSPARWIGTRCWRRLFAWSR